MIKNKYVLTQVLDLVPRYQFKKIVAKHSPHYTPVSFTYWEQFICLCYGQLTQKDSLRNIVLGLSSRSKKLYHIGIRSEIKRSTFSDANRIRPWIIYQDLAYVLIEKALKLNFNRKIFAPEDHSTYRQLNEELQGVIYALDASIISLCLSVFGWAKFRQTKGGVKMHTLLDLKALIPTFMDVTNAEIHDVNILDNLVFEIGAFYIMDRGYIDFARLYRIQQALAFFIIRAKSNLSFKVLKSNKVDKSTGLRCDQIIKFKTKKSQVDYPMSIRRVKFVDEATKITYVFLTNNFEISPLAVALLYKKRWKIELFFKWIKQHLKIKVFWGQNENAVKTQIWVAVCNYTLIYLLKKQLNLDYSSYEILEILRDSVFEKVPLNQLLTNQK